jgi:AraC-like DNA-binding protein
MDNLLALMPSVIQQWMENSLKVSFLKTGHAQIQDKAITDWRNLPFAAIAQSAPGTYEIQTQGKASFHTQTGGAFFVKANIPHRIVHHGNQFMKAKWIHVQFTVFESVDVLGFFEVPLILSPKQTQPVARVIGQLLSLRDQPNEFSTFAKRKELAFHVLGLICGFSTLKRDSFQMIGELERLKDVLAFLNQNYAKPIKVSDLAKLAHLSTQRFHAIFQGTMKKSPMEYVKMLRLNEARHKLARSNQSIAQIADSIGYPDQFHFSRTFKAAFKMSPSEYRKEHLDL